MTPECVPGKSRALCHAMGGQRHSTVVRMAHKCVCNGVPGCWCLSGACGLLCNRTIAFMVGPGTTIVTACSQVVCSLSW